MARIYMKGTKRLLKKPSMEEDTSNLPYEIIENILSRLPVKSLIRFKSVSKPWNSLISSTEFAKIHLHQSNNSDSQTLFLLSPSFTLPTICLLKFTNGSFQVEAEIEFPLKKYRKAEVLCSCNGLILLKNDRWADKMYVLWNLSTRTYKKFSCPYPIDFYMTTYGICYDPANDDYKVVVIFTSGFYAVFSYKNNSWTKELATMKIRWGPGLFVNGALYWVVMEHCQLYDVQAKEDLRLKLVSKRCDGFHYQNLPIYDCSYGYRHEIYYFDSETDKFKKLPKPECLEDHSSFNLTTLGGHLCLYRNTYDLTMVEIWMMKTYKSWMKLMTVENVPIDLQWSYHVKPLCLTNKGEVVLDISYSHFVVYNPKEKKFGDTNRNIHMALSPIICLDTLSSPTRVKRTKRKGNGHLKAET